MRFPAVTAVCSLLAASLGAQNPWVPPQLPSDISPGFFRLNSVPATFKIAAQQPNQHAAGAAYRGPLRRGLATIARIGVLRARAYPPEQRAQRLRQSRQSLAPFNATDSAVLERMKQSAGPRRARGARLSPADQRAF